jgi:CheY-like chemotaxis protein
MVEKPRYRILVVDDFPDAARITCTLFNLLGHDCHAVESGREALALCDRVDPHIVLCDIGLPDISGYEVARILRSRPLAHPMHLCAVTGWGTAKDRAEALAAGFDQHVVKPTDASVLRAVLSTATQHFA